MSRIDYMNAKGFLQPDERKYLYKVSRETVPTISGVMINIGVEYGASMACLRAGNPTAWLVGIDIDMSKYEGPKDDRIILIQTRSYNAYLFWKKPIDLLFVDGDHGFKGVMDDTLWTLYLRPGKLVIYQDCYDWDVRPPVPHKVCPGVNKAVETWSTSNQSGAWTELDYVGTSRVFKRREL